jgi:small ligand-binding sensory domain FIST
MTKTMKWASSVVSTANLGEAVARAAAAVRTSLGGETADLCLVFVSPHFKEAYERIPSLVQEHLPARVLAGCSAGGVIGGGVEVENQPALALVAARLPDVRVQAIFTDTQGLPDDDAPPAVWRSWLGLREGADPHFVVLADPFTSAVDPLLTGLDYAFPGTAKIGGLASGGRQRGENALFEGGRVHRAGTVLVALSGNIEVDTIVAQGCRPIGRPLTITRCENNVLLEVDGQAPLRYLAELVEQAPEEDRRLMRTSLFLGIQADDLEVGEPPPEYLMRNLVGIDYARGILAVSAPLRTGQVVHFHLRDKEASSGDLNALLGRYRARAADASPRGALLFSCVGRGRVLYGEANHDTRVFAEHLGAVPLGGFFCNGEIGPVSRATHIHGYTSAFGLFRPAGKD